MRFSVLLANNVMTWEELQRALPNLQDILLGHDLKPGLEKAQTEIDYFGDKIPSAQFQLDMTRQEMVFHCELHKQGKVQPCRFDILIQIYLESPSSSISGKRFTER